MDFLGISPNLLMFQLKATTSSVIVLFTITSPSAVTPSTEYRHELTVEEAVDNLNATLHDDDLVIHVTKTQQVKVGVID